VRGQETPTLSASGHPVSQPAGACHPCEEFFASEDACEKCEAWWRTRLDSLAEELGQEKWLRWASPFYADGVRRIERGNPIASGRSRQLDRAFRIVHHHAPEASPGVYAYVQTYDDLDETVDFPAAELFISMVWSEQDASLVLEIVKAWMAEDMTTASMEDLLRERLPESQNP
jgi:hypothetical protein